MKVHKVLMGVKEASEYFGLSERKIREIANRNPNSKLWLYSGNRLMVKVKPFEDYLMKVDVV